MKYAFQIIDVLSSTPFGGNQLSVLADAVGFSTEGMQKIVREFNFGETTFVLPKNDPANTARGGWTRGLRNCAGHFTKPVS
jgi:trans-2,3-dihydro-3-hydroxyanthranilate isomerase